MFRLSDYVRELLSPTPLGPRREPSGPVVIWNLIRRCNLTCRHCYSISADIDFKGELSTAEAETVMDDLKRFGVPVLILSGGEPLLRPDLFHLAERAKSMGFYVALSTNGTLIDAPVAQRIADLGLNYVGISLDGIGATHDRFRRLEGAFDRSLQALRLLRDLDVKVGVRYTLTADNAADLPALLDLIDAERIHRFYFSHLNYAGRGNINRKHDAVFTSTRQAMDLLFERCYLAISNGQQREYTTGNNDADAIYFLHWVRRRFPELPPARLEQLATRLRRWGGNASGVNIANIDNLGNVHPDTMWWNWTLGNVRERPFSAIWSDRSDPDFAGLRSRPRPVEGRCGACRYLPICNGNTRVRAQQLTGRLWSEDPGCYLTDEEVGIGGQTRETGEVTA